MSYNSIHKCLTNDQLWIVISAVLLGWYLSPLFHHTFYVPIFDNLDSNVVWYKILAESGKIFASNDEIIPNMMNGLPRASYGGEFDLILWLYYFFTPKTAYIINEILIHLLAFVSMFVFLKVYVVPKNRYYGNVPVFLGSLYFALLPFWSGAGGTIALLPLVTYALLEIKNGKGKAWEWGFLAIVPLYASFVLVYVFYITMAGIFLLYDAVKNKKINYRFFSALLLMTTAFLLSEYRLVYAMFFDPGFVSHRTEFQIFFQDDLKEAYRLVLVKLLQGHPPHADPLQQPYVLPIVLSAMALEFFRKRLNTKESVIVWIIIALSFVPGVWNAVLIEKYTIPGLALFAIAVMLYVKRFRMLPKLFLLLILLSFIASGFEYRGLAFLGEMFPVLKSFNMIRMIFVEPFVYGILLAYSAVIVFRKLRFAAAAVFVFLTAQAIYSFQASFYQTQPNHGYASFEEYYIPDLFEQLKKGHPEIFSPDNRFVSYGMEPSVALFNGLYTVDGYSPNYPLEYKYRFRKIFENYKYPNLYNQWGSKVYIVTVPAQMDAYRMMKGLKLDTLRFDSDVLCSLGTTYLLSPYRFKHPEQKQLKPVAFAAGKKGSWDLYLYQLGCP